MYIIATLTKREPGIILNLRFHRFCMHRPFCNVNWSKNKVMMQNTHYVNLKDVSISKNQKNKGLILLFTKRNPANLILEQK